MGRETHLFFISLIHFFAFVTLIEFPVKSHCCVRVTSPVCVSAAFSVSSYRGAVGRLTHFDDLWICSHSVSHRWTDLEENDKTIRPVICRHASRQP